MSAFESIHAEFEAASDFMTQLEEEGQGEGDTAYDAATFQGAALMLELFALCECLVEDLPDMQAGCEELQSIPEQFAVSVPAQFSSEH